MSLPGATENFNIKHVYIIMHIREWNKGDTDSRYCLQAVPQFFLLIFATCL